MSKIFMALAEGVNRICGAVIMRGGTEDDIQSITLTLDPETFDRVQRDMDIMRLSTHLPTQRDLEGVTETRIYGVLVKKGLPAPKKAHKDCMSEANDKGYEIGILDPSSFAKR